MTFKPHVFINAGFAGGFKKRGAALGDVYLDSELIFNHDRYFTDDDPYKAYYEGGFPAFYHDKLATTIGAKKSKLLLVDLYLPQMKSYAIWNDSGLSSKI